MLNSDIGKQSKKKTAYKDAVKTCCLQKNVENTGL